MILDAFGPLVLDSILQHTTTREYIVEQELCPTMLVREKKRLGDVDAGLSHQTGFPRHHVLFLN